MRRSLVKWWTILALVVLVVVVGVLMALRNWVEDDTRMYAADVNPFDAVYEGEAPPVEGLPEGDVNPFDAMFAEEAPKVQGSNLTPGERREIIIKRVETFRKKIRQMADDMPGLGDYRDKVAYENWKESVEYRLQAIADFPIPEYPN